VGWGAYSAEFERQKQAGRAIVPFVSRSPDWDPFSVKEL
jgi:hypothetical protein